VKAKPPRYVLDSFAVVAYIEKEPGSWRVAEVLAQARRRQAEVLMCLVNFGEVAYIIEREHGLADAQDAIALLDQLPIQMITADRPLTLAAAHIKAHYPIAYGDAFAIALAQKQKAIVLTGDPEFRSFERLLTIEWLPQA
jgi:predicted nucleic acid-binding protein